METIRIKKLSDKATIPTRGSEQAAGYDLYAANLEMITIAPHETVKVPTDLAIEIPNGYFGGVFARSGLATKQGLRPGNCVGVVDSDYRGNVIGFGGRVLDDSSPKYLNSPDTLIFNKREKNRQFLPI